MAGNVLKLLALGGTSRNVLKWLNMASYNWKWLELLKIA